MSGFCQCPRCGSRGLENLGTHAHCVECLYFDDRHYDPETAYHEACEAEALIAPSGDTAMAELPLAS